MLAVRVFWHFRGVVTMYAVFENGSRQYIVEEGDVVRIDFREAEVGDDVTFDRVLLVRQAADLHMGRPVLTGARVLGEVIDHPTEKYYIQHFRRRKNYRRFKGHRQPYTEVLIHNILLAGQEPPPEEEEEQAAPQEPQQQEQHAGAEAHG